jgi:hypothetical protein
MVLRRALFALCVVSLISAACATNDTEVLPLDGRADRVVGVPPLHFVDAGEASVSDAAVEAPPPPDASCNVVAKDEVIQPGIHVPEGTAIDYPTNPPSSGEHYPVWANFQEYDHPVADGYLVHSMEHGAVALFYDCIPGACAADPGVLEALRAVRAAVPTDPLCDPSIRVRVIIAPRPANDSPITAAAWGATYHADCVDAPSLAQFIADHYAKAPENFCSPGATNL